MPRILMILALCATATAPRADTELTPRLFDMQKQFDQCINTPSDNPYLTCQGMLAAGFTLRREIGYALDVCVTANVEGCVTAFNDAGFPAERLNIATLAPCTMLGRLEETEVTEIPENSCINQIARNIERNAIPTTHSTEISCGINYIDCAGIIDLGTKYWENAVWAAFYEKLNAVPDSPNFDSDSSTSHRYYSLLEQKQKLQIDLAETNCNLLTVIPHWGNVMDYQSCMGEAYMQIWTQLKEDGE
jgi:hypothetical protein